MNKVLLSDNHREEENYLVQNEACVCVQHMDGWITDVMCQIQPAGSDIMYVTWQLFGEGMATTKIQYSIRMTPDVSVFFYLNLTYFKKNYFEWMCLFMFNEYI